MKQFTSGPGMAYGTAADVLVVGAGPSGATAAYRLTAVGPGVLGPPCGGEVTDRLISGLDRLVTAA